MRVLITQSSLANIGGSEVQTLELAQFLRQEGHQVLLYTWLLANPMARIIEGAGFEVLDPECSNGEKLSPSEFDLIWVQHEVLPEALIRRWNQEEKKPVLIFSHLSPLRELWLENPYLYGLEDKIADAICFNAKNSLEAQQPLFENQSKLMLFPNPAPEVFQKNYRESTTGLRTVLVVSNHPPAEVNAAAALLRQQDITVDYLSDLSSDGSKSQVVTPEILKAYDCVVTIGKTVQYCLVMGIPVFIYDRFAGPGYLNEENYALTRDFNFSGRVAHNDFSLLNAKLNSQTRAMSGEQIARQIVENYCEAADYIHSHKTDFQNEFSYSDCFKTVWDAARHQHSKRPDPRLEESRIENLCIMQKAMQNFISLTYLENHADRVFYQQPIQVFRSDLSEDGNYLGFDEEESEKYPDTLTEDIDFALTLPRRTGRIRIDFGERPCVVTGFEILKSRRRIPVKVETNCAFCVGDTYVFLKPDPQLIVEFAAPANWAARSISNVLDLVASQGRNSQTKFHIKAQVFPLNAAPYSLFADENE